MSSAGKRSRWKKISMYNDVTMDVNCQWADCVVISESMTSAYEHMKVHILDTVRKTTPLSDDYQCRWVDCGVVFNDENEFHIHCYFHILHVKLKYLGDKYRVDKKLDTCCLDSSTRNLVPDIVELTCHWKDCENTSFQNPEQYYLHVSCHVEGLMAALDWQARCKQPMSCEWTSCEAVAVSAYKLRDHMKAHTQEKKVACSGCGSLFASNTKFHDHLVRQKDSNTTGAIKCSYCPKTFVTQRIWRDHVRTHINQYKCPFCDMTCINASALRDHIQLRHCSLRPFPCPKCDYSAKRSYDLRKHMQMHTNAIRPCPYTGCLFSTHKSWTLQKHMRETHMPERVYACHLCEMKFSQGSKISRHLQKVHHLSWPSGHTRFQYRRTEDDVYMVQLVRYENSDLIEGIVQEYEGSESNEEDVDDPASSASTAPTALLVKLPAMLQTTTSSSPASIADGSPLFFQSASAASSSISESSLNLNSATIINSPGLSTHTIVNPSVVLSVSTTGPTSSVVSATDCSSDDAAAILLALSSGATATQQ